MKRILLYYTNRHTDDSLIELLVRLHYEYLHSESSRTELDHNVEKEVENSLIILGLSCILQKQTLDRSQSFLPQSAQSPDRC